MVAQISRPGNTRQKETICYLLEWTGMNKTTTDIYQDRKFDSDGYCGEL